MAADPSTRQAVDDIFDDSIFDLDEDPFADRPVTNIQDTRDDKPTLSPRAAAKRKARNDETKEDFGLGLDEEVKIAKKRKPIAKLDEARLLSEPGIPKMRSLVRSKQMGRKLRLKGKGHEFTDAARLLNYYQLWLDNLYPRAKFADALQLVEKAGHTKRMQIIRSEWINESKPGYLKSTNAADIDIEVRPDEMPDLFAAQPNPDFSNQEVPPMHEDAEFDTNDDSMFIPDSNQRNHNKGSDNNDNDEPEDDELDALLAMQDDYHKNSNDRSSKTNQEPSGRQTPQQGTEAEAEAESEGDDDLDALLAEQDARQLRLTDRTGASNNPPALTTRNQDPSSSDDGTPKQQPNQEEDDDHNKRPENNNKSEDNQTGERVLNADDSQENSVPADLDEDGDDDDDDLLAALGEAESRQTAQMNSVGIIDDSLLSSSPVPNE